MVSLIYIYIYIYMRGSPKDKIPVGLWGNHTKVVCYDPRRIPLYSMHINVFQTKSVYMLVEMYKLQNLEKGARGPYWAPWGPIGPYGTLRDPMGP